MLVINAGELITVETRHCMRVKENNCCEETPRLQYCIGHPGLRISNRILTIEITFISQILWGENVKKL